MKEKLIMKNLVVKGNSLNECFQNLPYNELKTMLLAFVIYRENGENSHFVRVDASRFAKVFEVDLSTAHLALKQCVEKLITRQFTFFKDNKNKVKTTWIAGIEYVYGENAIILALSPHVVDELTKLEANFTSYYLEQISPFKSVYSIRIFEIMKQWKSAGKTPVLDISDFRLKLGILPSEYQRINNFKAKVLDLAMSEINEKTDMNVEYTQIKKGRVVSGFQFTIKDKNKKEKDVTPNNNGDYWLNDKQVNYFASLLAKDPALGSNHCISGKSEAEFAMQLASELKGTAKQREFLKPYLLKHGFDMKFALSQPPTTTPQPQEPVTVVNDDDDRASKIYKTVEPVPTAPPPQQKAVEVVPSDPLPVDIDERQKKADEFLSNVQNLLKNKILKA